MLWQRSAWQKKKKHNWWIESKTKTKEEKAAGTKILIEIKKKKKKKLKILYEKCPFTP